MHDLAMFLRDINSILMSLFGMGITSIAWAIYKQLRKRNENTESRFKNLEYAIMTIQHDKIYKYCEEYLGQGWISVDDLKNLEKLYTGYKRVDGNDTAEALYNKVRALPNHPVKEGFNEQQSL